MAIPLLDRLVLQQLRGETGLQQLLGLGFPLGLIDAGGGQAPRLVGLIASLRFRAARSRIRCSCPGSTFAIQLSSNSLSAASSLDRANRSSSRELGQPLRLPQRCHQPQTPLGVSDPATEPPIRDGLEEADQVSWSVVTSCGGLGFGHGEQPFPPNEHHAGRVAVGCSGKHLGGTGGGDTPFGAAVPPAVPAERRSDRDWPIAGGLGREQP